MHEPGPAIRACAACAKLTAPHETALFAMAANRLDDPISKLACAERWLPDPILPGCPTRPGSRSISAIARSTSSRFGRTRSSATSSSAPPDAITTRRFTPEDIRALFAATTSLKHHLALVDQPTIRGWMEGPRATPVAHQTGLDSWNRLQP